MSSIAISVIIPVYNSENYIAECLESILNQSFQNFEVICVDDGSTDSSLSILNDYANIDSRIKVFSLKKSNAGAARNYGLKKAVGKYLSFLDSDDYFDSRMFQLCFERMEKDDSDIVIYSANKFDMITGNHSLITDSLNIKNCPDKTCFCAMDMKPYIFNSFQNWAWNKMFRASFIHGNSLMFQEIQRTNDMAFTCTALVVAKRISIIPEPLVTYRTNSGFSLQDTNYSEPLCFWEAYTETRNRLESMELYKIYEQSFLNWILNGILYNLENIGNKDLTAYQEAYCVVSQLADKEFGFSNYGLCFYYNKKQYLKFKILLKCPKLYKLLKRILILKK